MKLVTILLWSFMLIALVGTLSASYFIYSNSEKTLEEQVSNNLLSDSQLIEKSIETFLDAQERKIELIATQSELSNEELNAMIKIDPAFYDLFVIASNGTVIASSDSERVGMDRANRSYFVNARNQTYVNPVYYALVPKEYSVSVSTPFHEGVLVGSIKISSLGDLLSDRTGLGKTGESLMTFKDENGSVVYFTKRLFSDKVIVVAPFENVPLPMQNALEDNEVLSLNTLDYRGVEVIAFSNYIERIDVGMVTKIDYSEAIGDTREKLIRLSILIAGIAIVIVFIIGWIISFKISRPIRKLTEGVDNITKGDLGIQLERSNIFEIQKLTDSLNRILATMKLAILRTGLSKSDIGIGEAVKAKEEAEAKYKLMYETSMDARLILSPPNWNFSSGNPAAIKMFNVKDEEQLKTLTPADLSPEKQPDGLKSSIKAKKMIEKALREGRVLFDWTHKRYNGESFPANVLLSKFDEGGKTYIQSTVRDIGKEVAHLGTKKK